MILLFLLGQYDGTFLLSFFLASLTLNYNSLLRSKPAPQPAKYDTIDLDDDDDDVQELDPELVSIAQKLSKRSGLTRNTSDDAMISPTRQPNSYFSSSSQPGSGLQSPNPMFSPPSQEHSGSQETATPVVSTPAIDINIMIRKIRDPRLVVPPDMEQVMLAIEAPIKFIIKSVSCAKNHVFFVKKIWILAACKKISRPHVIS